MRKGLEDVGPLREHRFVFGRFESFCFAIWLVTACFRPKEELSTDSRRDKRPDLPLDDVLVGHFMKPNKIDLGARRATDLGTVRRCNVLAFCLSLTGTLMWWQMTSIIVV